jgi:threonine dehydratase
LKFFEDGLTKAQLNRFRFEVLRDLASGKITAREAKVLCGVNNAINQTAVFVAQEDKSYLRLEGGVSALSH